MGEIPRDRSLRVITVFRSSNEPLQAVLQAYNRQTLTAAGSPDILAPGDGIGFVLLDHFRFHLTLTGPFGRKLAPGVSKVSRVAQSTQVITEYLQEAP